MVTYTTVLAIVLAVVITAVIAVLAVLTVLTVVLPVASWFFALHSPITSSREGRWSGWQWGRRA